MVRSPAVASLVVVVLLACNSRDGGGGASAPPAIPDADHGPSTPSDIDGDGIPNESDNCPSVANADQRDACTYPPRPDATGDDLADGLARLNWYRTLVGLGPARLDPALSNGCMLHVQYLLAASADAGGVVLTHDEDLTRPYASEEGNRAGGDSVLSYGRGDMADAIDGWINTLYHRLPLVHPGLERVGMHFEEGFGCLLYRQGTTARTPAPHPILWPPPDIVGIDRMFGGDEAPCPTVADPLAGGPCPGAATIASVGLHGMGALTGVSGTYVNLDTGAPVDLFATYWEGGPSPHEQMGYLEQHAALVPLPDSSLDRAGYEVTIDATVGGTPETFRWRFRTARDLPEVGCDDLGDHHTLDVAYEIDRGTVEERICEFADFYRLTGDGTRRVRIDFDGFEGDLDLAAIDETGAGVQESNGTGDSEVLESVPTGLLIEVYGFEGAMGPYVLTVE